MVKKITGLKIAYWIVIAIIVIAAIAFRLDLYLFGRSIWFDEAALFLNIKNGTYRDLFSNLLLNQAAPPMFLVLTKFLTSLLGYAEYVLRFLPFIAGLISIFLFYKVALEFLKREACTALAMVLFAFNINLIYYSQEFKQYSFDVLFTLAALYIALKLNFNDKRTVLAGGIALALMPWFSHASIIVVFSIFTVYFFKFIKQKKSNYKLFIIPSLINMPFYFIHHLKSANGNEFLHNFWSLCYLDKTATNLLELMRDNVQYIFAPFKGIVWLLIIVLIIGSAMFFKSDKFKFWLLLTPYFVLLMLAYLHLYPYGDRLTLFLTPMFIIIFSKIFCRIRLQYFTVIFLIICSLSAPNFIKMYKNMKNLPAQGKQIFEILADKYREGDIVVVNEFSNAEFSYYSYLNNFKPDNIIKEDYKTLKTPADYQNFLKKLPQNYNYWFFTTQIFPTLSTKEYIQDWAITGRKPINIYTKGASDLYYVRN